MPNKVAVVTGSNKGIGFGIVKALCQNGTFGGTVYLTARDETRGKAALARLNQVGLYPKFHKLDIVSVESIRQFGNYIKDTHGGLDILVNNAAIEYEPENAVEPFSERAENTIRVNFFGLLNVCRELFPLLRPGARVVNLSSAAGHISRFTGKEPECTSLRNRLLAPDLTTAELVDLIREYVELAQEGKHKEAGWPDFIYGVSKVAVSALTRIQQRELDQGRPADDIAVNAVNPGFVQTDMTNQEGHFSIERGAQAPVWCALLPPNVERPRGGYVWHDKRIASWADDRWRF